MSEATSTEETVSDRSSRDKGHDTFVPVLLLALAVALWFCFQTVQLLKERAALGTTMAAQDKTMQEAKKLRDSLDAVARETALLADRGNQNAKLIVDELRKRGITINPNPINPNPTPDSSAIPAK